MAHSSEHKNNHANLGAKETVIFKEMIPFVVYAAIPLFITICIALYFGSTHQ